jgi:hypothetical protein
MTRRSFFGRLTGLAAAVACAWRAKPPVAAAMPDVVFDRQTGISIRFVREFNHRKYERGYEEFVGIYPRRLQRAE